MMPMLRRATPFPQNVRQAPSFQTQQSLPPPKPSVRFTAMLPDEFKLGALVEEQTFPDDEPVKFLVLGPLSVRPGAKPVVYNIPEGASSPLIQQTRVAPMHVVGSAEEAQELLQACQQGKQSMPRGVDWPVEIQNGVAPHYKLLKQFNIGGPNEPGKLDRNA